MASGVYANGIKALCGAGVDWDDAGTTVKAQLTINTYTPDFDAHDFQDDVSAYKMTGTTDQTIGSKAINIDTANNRVHLDGPASITFTAVQAGSTVTGVVIYKDTGTPGTSALVCWNEFSASVATNGSDIQVTFDTDGHVRFTY